MPKINQNPDEFQKLAFSVDCGPLDETIMEKAPIDGYEYIKQVMFEKSQLDEVVTVAPPNKKNTHQIKPTETAVEKTKSHFGLTLAQKSNILVEFHTTKSKTFKKLEAQNLSSIKQTEKVQINSYDSWVHFVESHKPSLLFLIGTSQPMIDVCLGFHTDLFDVEFYPTDLTTVNIDKWKSFEKYFHWFYHLLVFKQIPLLPDTHSLLRDFVQEAIELRNRLESWLIQLKESREKLNESRKRDFENAFEVVASINMIICLIANYFHQCDLDEFC